MNKRRLFLFCVCSSFYCSGIAQENPDSSMNVFFKTNGFELDTIQLSTIKNFLTAYPVITHITGYTDITGASAYNLTLAKKRAFAIYDAIKHNMDSLSTDIVTYYGESEELPEVWMNRRVQIRARKPSLLIKEKSVALKTNKASVNVSDSLNKTMDTIRVINLENLYFYPDKPILAQESIPYLEELAQQLTNYPAATFEIIGHVNYQSRFDSTHLRDLYQLSRLRAKAVYDYLAEFGIPDTRMRYKGVGNSQPLITSPKNDGEKRKNMRVQVIIMGK